MKISRKENLLYGIPFFAGAILQIFAIDYFRLTFVPITVSVGIYLVPAIAGLVLFYNNIIGKGNYNFRWVIVGLTYCIISIGGTLVFLFLFTNYYLAGRDTVVQSFPIVKTDIINGKYSKCNNSIAVIHTDKLTKEVFFNCDELNNLKKHKSITVALSKGALGFDVIRTKEIGD